MKNLDDIWQEYINQNSLSTQTLKDLIWHIENDVEQEDSIIMSTDMMVKEPNNVQLKKLTPYIAKQLDHEDDFIREITISSLVGRLKLPEYAEKVLNMAKNDSYKNVRDSANASLGAVIDTVDFNLRKQIAIYLYDVMTNIAYSDLHKQSSYRSILKAMKIPINLWPPQKLNPDIQNMVDKDLMKKFKIKYNIEDAA